MLFYSAMHVVRQFHITVLSYEICIGFDIPNMEVLSLVFKKMYRILPLKRPRQISAHPHFWRKVLCRVNCTRTIAHCQLLVQRLDWSYGGPEVQKTRFWNPGLTTFRDDGIIYGRLGRSPITRFGMRMLTFGVQALTFTLRTLTLGVQMPSSVCERSRSECKRRVRSANIHIRCANA